MSVRALNLSLGTYAQVSTTSTEVGSAEVSVSSRRYKNFCTGSLHMKISNWSTLSPKSESSGS